MSFLWGIIAGLPPVLGCLEIEDSKQDEVMKVQVQSSILNPQLRILDCVKVQLCALGIENMYL